MTAYLILALVIVGWIMNMHYSEFFTQDPEISRQTGRIAFFKKQMMAIKSKITIDTLNSMLERADQLDGQAQTLMENMKPKAAI
jgi:hypothetical protein